MQVDVRQTEAELFSATAELAWKPSANARSYRVSVSDTAEFTRIVAMETAATLLLAVSGFNGPVYDHENDGEPRRYRSLSSPLQNAGRYTPSVPQQRAVGRIMHVTIHDRGIRPDDTRVDASLLDAVGGEHFVDAFPDGWLNGFEALIEKGVVHDRLLPRANEVF